MYFLFSGIGTGRACRGAGSSRNAGDRRLEASHGKRIGKRHNRADQLIDAYIFRTESTGQENTVEKADDPADHACGSQ